MAITTAFANSFKVDALEAFSGETFKIALFTSSATLSKDTTSYTGLTNEVASGSGYTAGGATLASPTVSLSGDTAVLTFTSPIEWTSASFTARGALIYIDSIIGKPAVSTHDFGSDYTATNGTFQITLPTANAASAIVRIA